MRLFLSLFKYHVALMMKSSKMVMPVLAWFIYMAISYTILPIDVVSSIMLSCIVLFYIMVWIGITYFELEDPVAEQIIILKTRSETLTYISKILFLLCFGIIMSIFGMLIPLIQNAVHGFEMYTRPITIYDITVGIFLHILTSLLAISLSSLFHTRIIKKRKLAILLTFLIALLSLVKGSIIESYPITHFILWILPPVSNLAATFTQQKYFQGFDVIKIIACFLIYSFVYLSIHVSLLKYKKF